MIRNILLIAVFAVSSNGWLFNREHDVQPQSSSQWPSLRTTFSVNLIGDKTFDKMPLTTEYAESQGWTKAADGCASGQFAGSRYIYKGDTAMSLLYDVNGIISGIQMNAKIAELKKQTNPYKFDANPMFQKNVIGTDEVYSTTAYFVDPATICNGGRTATQLEQEGVGNQLYLQNGPTPAQSETIPMQRDLALSSKWTNNKCFPMMGTHTFYDVEHMDDTQCLDSRPAFLLFNKQGKLHGFGFQLFGTLKSDRYENPPLTAVEMIMGKQIVPQCVYDMDKTIGQTTMHVYFVEHPTLINCF